MIHPLNFKGNDVAWRLYFYSDKLFLNFFVLYVGAYCGEGAYTIELCPPGTYSNLTHQISIDNCTDCPPGYYCSDRGAIEPTGQCDAGHICYQNALFATPVYNNDSSGGE